jgi:hypothetical protein
MRREETKAMRVVMKMNFEWENGRGRSKNTWLDTIENDMKAVGMSVRDVENRYECRFRTRVAESK